MTFGQLFTKMHPDVRIIENGSCVWLFMDDVNHYTIANEWWNQEVTSYALELLKDQETVKPMLDIDTWVCGNCGARIERQSMIAPNVLISETLDVCPNCGKKVKWDAQTD